MLVRNLLLASHVDCSLLAYFDDTFIIGYYRKSKVFDQAGLSTQCSTILLRGAIKQHSLHCVTPELEKSLE